MLSKIVLALALTTGVSAKGELSSGSRKQGIEQLHKGKVEVKWPAYKAQYGKTYNDEEEPKRKQAFSDSLRRIAMHPTDSTWKAGITQYSDLTWEEFQAVKGLGEGQNCSATHAMGTWKPTDAEVAKVPDAIDWREKGAVSPVKDQGSCGSCWTFSTTGCLESHHYLATGKMDLFAEQQLVDCAGAFNNNGCNGGLPSQAFEYIKYAGGMMTEDEYPYTAKDGECVFDKKEVAGGVKTIHNITFQDEVELQNAIGLKGPVSIAYQVASDFHDYVSGVYSSTVCQSEPENVNHAVLAVGYNKDDSEYGAPYYIVKNSWAETFGMDGYFLIEMNKNMCGLADCASFPDAF